MNIHRTIEKYIGEKIEDNILEILSEAGFNTKFALLSIDDTSIKSIENHTYANPNSFTDILKGTKYEKLEIFKFLPSHISVILRLPKLCNEFTAKKPTQPKKGSIVKR